ncbi:sarcosine oxidase subunit gamma [Methylocella tundrae]|uniref:GCVT N-terminal domain-containing protein n=1 Tax=Methylocella tundrae TaxID=227605 RepID=A0A4V6IMT6_METTU|nr:sarcosine oxidase subunit gamma family protein [Methylocella tundrae]WPP03590.1 sarcosine oxidase subunit gamma family protein [Methylocella tundrae]VFU09703.1 conserved protein of unknown function [Methylocella tundrae]
MSDPFATSHAAGAAAGLALELTPHYFRAGRFGAPAPAPGVTLELVAGEDRFNIEARRGRTAELIAAIGAAFGQAPADGPQTVEAGGFSFVGVGPSRWHAIARGKDRAPRRAALIAAARDLATVVDVSHGFTAFRLSGPRAADALVKLVRLDLDPAAFPPGAAAATELHGMSVQLRRTTAGHAYECAVARSFAASLHNALIQASEPYALRVDLKDEV